MPDSERFDTADEVLVLLDVLATVDPGMMNDAGRRQARAGLAEAVALVEGLITENTASLAKLRAMRDRAGELLERFGGDPS